MLSFVKCICIDWWILVDACSCQNEKFAIKMVISLERREHVKEELLIYFDATHLHICQFIAPMLCFAI